MEPMETAAKLRADLAELKCSGQPSEALAGLGHHQQAPCCLVQPVHLHCHTSSIMQNVRDTDALPVHAQVGGMG